MASRILSWLVFFVIIGSFVYVFRDTVRDGAVQIYRLALPCTVPITYKIGTIDPKFGISETLLVKDLATASGLWNKALGKTLFVYEPEKGDVTVELIYDERQATTERLKELGVTISTDRQSYEIAKAKYSAMLSQYEAKKKLYEQHVAAFNSRKNEYEKQVDYWNGRGGAPRSEYAKLQTEQANLTSQSVELLQEQNALNQSAQDVNNLTKALNKLIAVLNLEVETYNATGDRFGDTFEQGLYRKELGEETITIFEYENNALLIRVLAHELGHALGLEHVADEDAVMYKVNQGERIALTGDDEKELARICRLN